MTTIVYDGKALASDSRSTIGDQIYEEDCQKLFPDVGPFVILGIAGNFQDATEVIDVIKAYNTIDQIRGLDFKELEWDCVMLAVTHEGTVWHYTGKYSFELRPDMPFAVGTGSHYAMGAMYVGADAKKAIEAAARFDFYTNNVIQVASLIATEETEEELH